MYICFKIETNIHESYHIKILVIDFVRIQRKDWVAFWRPSLFLYYILYDLAKDKAFLGQLTAHLPHFKQSASAKPLASPLALYGANCIGQTFVQSLQLTHESPLTIKGSGFLFSAIQLARLPIGQNVHHVL